MELFESIRRQHRDEGLSIRELAERHHVHRRTVRQALINAVPPQRKAPERAASALGAHEATVRGWLEADLEVPRKQRHTARRVWQRLREEVDAEVPPCYQSLLSVKTRSCSSSQRIRLSADAASDW